MFHKAMSKTLSIAELARVFATRTIYKLLAGN